MLKTIKQLVPPSVKAYIRTFQYRADYKTRVESLQYYTRPFVLLIGTAIHTNLGDHLIALAEKDWLREHTGKAVIEIPREVYHLYKNKLANVDAEIYITGGGWMGDLWPNEEKDIQNIVSLFHNKKVTILPQTIYYEDKNSPLIERGNAIYETCDDLTLHVREVNSFNIATEYLSINNIVLSPDMGLLYKYKSNIIPNDSFVGICLRDDREFIRSNQLTDEILTLITDSGFSLKTVSTMSDHRVSEVERQQAVNEAIDSFAECGMLVVDRLHAMIFAYLAGRPCIAIDNKTRKVSGVYNKWLFDCPYILMVDNDTKLSDIQNFIKKMRGVTFEPQSFERYF